MWAVPETHVVFANEPLLEVTASLPEAQIVETIVLNQITLQTALATKAARCRFAAVGRATLVDFSLRFAVDNRVQRPCHHIIRAGLLS